MSPDCKYCSGSDFNYYESVNYWGGLKDGFGAGWMHGNRHPGGTESFCEDQEYWDNKQKEQNEIDAQGG